MAARTFRRRFAVEASLERVRAFHEDPRAVQRLTPAPLVFLAPPPPVRAGERIRFRMWLPWPVLWTARYERADRDGFVDVMEEGPFRAWRHEHAYRPLPDGRTEVEDVITAEPAGILSRLVWLGVPLTFRYRAWRTRRTLAER